MLLLLELQLVVIDVVSYNLDCFIFSIFAEKSIEEREQEK
jgi:hypothetical protein